MKKSAHAFCLIILTLFSRAAFADPAAQPATGSVAEALPHVAIAGFANKTGDASFDTPSATATESLELTIRRLAAYEIVAPDTLPASPTDAELLAWCQSKSVDFVLYGSIASAKGGAQAYDLAVFDRAKGKTTIKKTAKGSSVFDVFSCADTLTFAVIDAIAGRHVGFGSIAFEVANPSSAEGKAIVSLDGAAAAEGFGQIDRVVAGRHLVGVTWEAPGLTPKAIALVETEVAEGECASIEVTVPEAKKAQAKKAAQESDAASQSATMADDMVLVEGGTFTMGSDTGPLNERPAHEVTVGSYWMGKTEVTQGEFKKTMGYLPSAAADKLFSQKKIGDTYPVLLSSWLSAIEYCNARSLSEGYTPAYTIQKGHVTLDKLANGYRLPTEAEWEYAARGGINHDPFLYPGSDTAADVAVTMQTANGDGYAAVASRKPNSLGIYDMGGNVYEFCWDAYRSYSSRSSSSEDRVIRGGDSLHGNAKAKCTARSFAKQDLEDVINNHSIDISHNIGFRVVRSVSGGEE
ncbi:MAG TPA: SUMF1/EgtB/PvdO family nonheme iron enzyme [Treponemataceae bacterium]|nr:SUMF1/EgtB/PvdO family nonheme iron enzyme [Treponemataceae bacterium]